MTFDEKIHRWLDKIDGDLIVPVQAAKFVEQSDDDELRAWLWERREVVVCQRMGDILRSERATANARSQSRKFAQAVAAGEVEDYTSPLDWKFVIDDEDTRRPLRNMTKDDIGFAASIYDQHAKANAFEAAWLRAVQKQTPKGKTVGDVFTDEKLRAMRGDK